MEAFMVTTVDNPFDPFDQWDEWYNYDESHGYYTSGYLARIIVTSEELSPPDQQLEYNRVVDEIVKQNVLGLYRKVARTIPDSEI